MRGTGPAWWLCVAIAAGAAACGADGPPHTPAAPTTYGSDGGRPIAVRPHHEAGADEDAGTDVDSAVLFADAGSFEPLGPECEEQTPPDPLDVAPDGTFHNALTAPIDLGVSRVETTWGGDCSAPTIRITLSDGECPSGKGHEVEFQFDANAIADGKLTRGDQRLEPEPGNFPIRVRYRRPTSLDPAGAGEWGTCLGVVGMVTLAETPSVEVRGKLRGTFTMDLASCDDLAIGTRAVNGSFDVTLRRGLDDVCPTTK